jgi:molecular chaperone DnaK
MVREAEAHAEEDRKRREDVETRNQAEALTFQAEKTIKDLGDKVAAADRAEAERKIEEVRDALKGTEAAPVRARAAELAAVLERIGTAAYAASSAPGADEAGPAGDGSGPAGGDGAPGGADADTVEGEFKEV